MRAFSIDPDSQSVKEIDIHMQANTVYTFFNSILIDELSTLKQHKIYSDANALSEKKRPYFLGAQLLVGDALIVGQESLADSDATIPQSELEALLEYELNPFYTKVLDLLSSSDINLYRTFDVEKDGEKLPLNAEWVLYTFNIADERTKEYFISELKKVIESDGSVEEYIKKMAQLALNAAG